MPPILALILCTIFVLWLLRLEHKQSPDVSFVSWLPTIWLLLSAGKPLASWFGVGGVDMEEGSPLDRNFVGTLVIIGFVILAAKRFDLNNAIRKNIWVILLILYMFVSISWSDMPYISLKRFIREAMAPLVMAFVILTEQNPSRAVATIFRRIISISIPYSLMLIKYFSHLGVQYNRWSGEQMWIGVSIQKNGLALLCLFAIFFLVWTLIRRWQGHDKSMTLYQTYVDIFILMLAFWLFLGPNHTLKYSATATIALAIGLLALGGIFWLKRQNILMGAKAMSFLIGVVILFGTVIPFSSSQFMSDIASVFERSENLTGRTDIWAYLIPYAMQKFFWGHGFGGFWTDAIKAATSSNAHNGFLDIILDLGFIGYLIFTIFFLNCCRKAAILMRTDFYWGSLWFCFILIAMIHNITESSTTSFLGIMGAIQLFLLLSYTSKSENGERNLQEGKY